MEALVLSISAMVLCGSCCAMMGYMAIRLGKTIDEISKSREDQLADFASKLLLGPGGEIERLSIAARKSSGPIPRMDPVESTEIPDVIHDFSPSRRPGGEPLE